MATFVVLVDGVDAVVDVVDAGRMVQWAVALLFYLWRDLMQICKYLHTMAVIIEEVEKNRRQID